MADFIEKREYFRMRIDCDVHCKHQGSDEMHIARATSLSGAGISFITTQTLTIGDRLHISIHPGHSITPSMTAEAHIIRVVPLENKEFEIGATLKVLPD